MGDPRISYERVTFTILEALVQSTVDRDDASERLDAIFKRSEAWAQSYMVIRLNDAIRAFHGEPEAIYVTIEARVDHFDDWVFDDGVNPPNYLSGILTDQQKFDLAVWGNDDYLVGLIELKNAPGQHDGAFVKDAQRLQSALRRWGAANGGSLAWGLYVFSIRVPSDHHMGRHKKFFDEKLDARRRALEEYVGAHNLGVIKTRAASDDDDCALWWCVAPITG